jgi:AcrR family transcriptional regulator/DNA-binding MarR family transcriptional regulator
MASRDAQRPVVRASLNGSPRTQVTEVQRARMLMAAVEVVGERGYGGMSVARITGRAGVSRRTFYDLFEDREDCFLAVFEEALARASLLATEAASGEQGWRERVRAGLTALLGFVGDEPVQGSLLVKDVLGAGPKVLKARARGLDTLHAIVDEGRAQARGGPVEPPPLTAEGVVGAVLAVVHARMLEHDKRPLVGLVNPLMGMIVLPYLGRAAAARELARPTPKAPRARQRKPAKDPLEGLDMRLTYRTLRVLAAIAEHPGASNRHVADAAGVHDQGQISKLLNRLEHLGLIHNTSQGHPKGEPNAWTLTPRGHEVERAIGFDSGRPSDAPARP